MFDQQHFVAQLVVNHFVHNLPDDEHAEAAGPKAHFGAPDGTVHHGLRRARRGSVREPVGIEPAPWIAEVINDGALGAGRGDLDHLARIEARAVLHRVHQHLAERRQQQVAFAEGQRLLVLGHEPHEPVRGEQVAGDAQRHPVGKGRHHLDPVAPVDIVERRSRHADDLAVVERRREDGEHVRAERADQVLVADRRRKRDDLRAWTDCPNLCRKGQVVLARRRRVGDQHVHGAVAHQAERLHGGVAELDVVVPQARVLGQRGLEGGIRPHHQQSPHSLVYSLRGESYWTPVPAPERGRYRLANRPSMSL